MEMTKDDEYTIFSTGIVNTCVKCVKIIDVSKTDDIEDCIHIFEKGNCICGIEEKPKTKFIPTSNQIEIEGYIPI